MQLAKLNIIELKVKIEMKVELIYAAHLYIYAKCHMVPMKACNVICLKLKLTHYWAGWTLCAIIEAW